MKTKLIFAIFFLFILNFSIKAQIPLIMLENFSYPAGDSLGAHGWVSFSGGNTNVLSVVSPGLIYPGYPGSNIGNCCHMSNNGQDAYKQFDSITSGYVYVAFMVRIDSAKTGTGDYFFALLPSNSTSNYTARTFVHDSTGSGNIAFGIIKSTTSTGPLVYGAPTFSIGATCLLIVKYKFNTGSTTDDEISLFAFSSGVPSTEPSTPYAGPVTGTITDAPNISRVALRQGSATTAATLNIDGFRVATSWSNLLTSLKNISTVAPDFKLSQNYPNPFNPTTNIRFSLPSKEFVTLKTYNSLGMEVSTLVNQNLNAGIYEVNFDGKDLSSGTYYYRLTAGNYTETKKMLMIK
jgi:hypothetical protein